jgi:hypothetical protein
MVEDPVDRVLQSLMVRCEPPRGRLLDPELLVALAEGRLTAAERAGALEEIRRSPAARAECRELYPEVFREAVARPANVVAFPRRPWKRLVAAGVAVTALAAALLIALAPPGAPVGSGLSVMRGAHAGDTVRGGDPGVVTVGPGEKIDLLMRLGAPSGLDALRAKAGPWGALFMVDEHGRARLVCTHDDAECRASDKTMAWLFTAPRTAGTVWFYFVAASRPVARDDLRALTAGLDSNAPAEAAAELQHRLEADAKARGWSVHAHPPLVVGP